MRILREGVRGSDVRQWENFLIGQGFNPGTADGEFDGQTRLATIAFQTQHRLFPDGVVGNETFGQAMVLGLPVLEEVGTDSQPDPNFPPKPDFDPILGNSKLQATFGKFRFEPDPRPDNRENIRILDGWESENIVRIEVPQIAGIPIAGPTGALRCHGAVVDQFRNLFQAWDDAGLAGRILSWGGAFNARFVRGRIPNLSSHAFGIAFDINMAFNRLGARPALVGQTGAVRELVPIANEHGFFWGGHFKNRPDGMHFEVARLL